MPDSITVTPKMVFLDDPPQHGPGRVNLVFEKTSEDEYCECDVTYENVNYFWEDRTNEFQILRKAGDVLLGGELAWERCICVSPAPPTCNGYLIPSLIVVDIDWYSTGIYSSVHPTAMTEDQWKEEVFDVIGSRVIMRPFPVADILRWDTQSEPTECVPVYGEGTGACAYVADVPNTFDETGTYGWRFHFKFSGDPLDSPESNFHIGEWSEFFSPCEGEKAEWWGNCTPTLAEPYDSMTGVWQYTNAIPFTKFDVTSTYFYMYPSFRLSFIY